jgi:hypothetical protein
VLIVASQIETGAIIASTGENKPLATLTELINKRFSVWHTSWND